LELEVLARSDKLDKNKSCHQNKHFELVSSQFTGRQLEVGHLSRQYFGDFL
jgi:hypothetical protein